MRRSAVTLRGVVLLALGSPACAWDWDPYVPRDAVVRADESAAPDAAKAFDADDGDADAPAACGALDAPCCADASDAATPATCTAPLVCQAGRCATCPAGRAACGAECAELERDATHCGACGHACPAGAPCVAGVCVPPNDTRAAAAPVDLAAAAAVTLVTDTSGARHDATGPCACADGRDVFYRLTLTRTEIVYADTLGSSFETALFLQDDAGSNVTDARLAGGAVCNNRDGLGCATGAQSMIAARLGAGAYYLVLSGCGAGAATVHVQHLPVGNGPVARLALTEGVTQTVAGTTAGEGIRTSACCSDGPEDTYWFVTCPGFTARTLTASTCGAPAAAHAASLELQSAARALVSSCDQGACGAQAQLAASLPSGAGLHALYVDGCAGSGPYSAAVTLGACARGAFCDGACADTQRDPSHCGACGRACAPVGNADVACVAGACTFACRAGFADCNRLAADGCEASLATVADCGACGRACSTTNCTPACAAGACVVTCAAGFADCDRVAGNGCEVNVTTDRLHCGACGNRCVGVRVCVAGRCE